MLLVTNNISTLQNMRADDILLDVFKSSTFVALHVKVSSLFIEKGIQPASEYVRSTYDKTAYVQSSVTLILYIFLWKIEL